MKRELLIGEIMLATKSGEDLKSTLNPFSMEQLKDLKSNVDLLVRDLESPAEALLSTLKTILEKEPLSTLSKQSMECLFQRHLPEEHIPARLGL